MIYPCVCVCVCVPRRLLYWTEKLSDGKGRLMQCRLDGSDLRTVLRHRRQSSRRPRLASTQKSSLCTCPEISVTTSFAIDYTQPVSQPDVYVADSDTGDIWSVDNTGCHCQLIVNATTLSLTPSEIGQYTLDGCNSLISHRPTPSIRQTSMTDSGLLRLNWPPISFFDSQQILTD